MENIIKHYKAMFTNWNDFEGRANVGQFWWAVLVNFIVLIILGLLGSFGDVIGTVFTIIYVIYALVIIIPQITLGIRRLHDTKRSGWWYLIVFLPIIGWIILIIFWIQPTVK